MKKTLQEFFREDQERLLTELANDSSKDNSLAVMEKEFDRLSFRAAENSEGAEAEAAADFLRMARTSLPLITSVSEVRTWTAAGSGSSAAASIPSRTGSMSGASSPAAGKPANAKKASRRKWASRLALAGGAVLEAAAFLFLSLRAARGPVTVLETMLFAVGGGALLFLAGRWSAAVPAAETVEVRQEFLTDPTALLSTVRGMLVMGDSAISESGARQQRLLEEASQRALEETELRREESSYAGQNASSERKDAHRADGQSSAGRLSSSTASTGVLSKDELEFYSSLLETSYGSLGGSDSAVSDMARENISAVRYYLHRRGIETLDLEEASSQEELERCFDFLPAGSRRTLRPALLSGNRLLQKGLASA